jgi:hypothetical protein
MQSSYSGQQTSYGAAASLQGGRSSGDIVVSQEGGHGRAGAGPGGPDAKAKPEKPPLPAIKLDLGDLHLSMENGVWRGGPTGAGSTEEDVAEIRRLRSEVEGLREKLRVADEERALVDFKNNLLIEMV